MNTDFAQNTMKLRRIMDKMPNATVEDIKAEYIKQGGLLNKEETTTSLTESNVSFMVEELKKIAPKKSVAKVIKVAKKVTKK